MNNVKILIFIIFSFICICNAAAKENQPRYISKYIELSKSCQLSIEKFGVSLVGDTLCFYDNIDQETAYQFFKIVSKSSSIKRILIKSNGGDVSYAMDMGDYIYENKLDIIVDSQCLSSCANYLFIAANRKYVLPEGGVCWHGGPGDGSLLGEDATDEQRKRQDKVVERSNAFVARSKVNIDLFNEWPENWGDKEKSEVSFRFWCYDKEKMEKRYGVKNIIFYDYKD